MDTVALSRFVEEHITTLLSFPSNFYNSSLGNNLPSSLIAKELRKKAVTLDALDAAEKLAILCRDLEIATKLR
jgi:hypothetical protein